MSELPPGVTRQEFDGDTELATAGEPCYGERTAAGWREWSRQRSKLANMLERGLAVPLAPESRALYLGAAGGTTVSHLTDVIDAVYAVEFASRPMRRLVEVARTRTRLIPLLKDARKPATYAHVVEADLPLLFQDVATRDQAQVALRNRQFLAPDGRLVAAIKARSADVTQAPAAVFEASLATLEAEYEILETARLEPHHEDHLAVIARPAD